MRRIMFRLCNRKSTPAAIKTVGASGNRAGWPWRGTMLEKPSTGWPTLTPLGCVIGLKRHVENPDRDHHPE